MASNEAVWQKCMAALNYKASRNMSTALSVRALALKYEKTRPWFKKTSEEVELR